MIPPLYWLMQNNQKEENLGPSSLFDFINALSPQPKKSSNISRSSSYNTTYTSARPSTSINASKPAGITTINSGVGSQIGGNPSDFVKWFKPYADQVEKETGIPSLAMLAIVANETGWGNPRHIVGNNLFGIKGEGPAGTYSTPTWEDYGNGRVDIIDNFRAYHDIGGSFSDFPQFLNENSRYKGYQQYRDPQQFVNFIKSKGYATDPLWTQKLASIMRTIQQQGGY